MKAAWSLAFFAAAAGSSAAFGAEEGAHAPGIWEGGVGNSIITLVIFLGVIVLLGRYAWTPLLKVLREREAAIRTSLEDAKRERLAAEKLLADYKRQIDKAREEATAIVDEGRRDAEVVRKRIQDEARKEAGDMLERAKREITLARDSAIKELYDRTVDLATEVAAGIVRKSLSPEDHRHLVADTLERMKSADTARRN